VIGADVYNGTLAQLQSFKTQTGATFPLLLNGSLGTQLDGTFGNLYTLYYPDTDNYLVINRQGIVRYHAADLHGHGTRYVLGEIRATVDSLVGSSVGVGDPAPHEPPMLRVSPNPMRDAATIAFAHAGRAPVPATVTVHDLAGRIVARLWNAPADPGVTEVTWYGRTEDGVLAPAGVYLVRVAVGDNVATRRVVRVR
jgi:hypothetical protein